MSSYTKHHKKYAEDNRDRINRYKSEKYYEKKYGIPLAMNDSYSRNRKYYAKLMRDLKKLDVEVIKCMLRHYEVHGLREASNS